MVRKSLVHVKEMIFLAQQDVVTCSGMTASIKSLDSEGKERPEMEAEFLLLFLQIGENLLKFIS